MAWRKWIVRCVVYGIIGIVAAGALVYQRWTNPAAVREQVMNKLGEVFPGAIVSVDSARLRLLGGIQLNDLRLTHRKDPESNEFLHVPSAVLYHDKEKIIEGKLALRKLELFRPRLRVRREADGRWNLQGLTDKIRHDLAIPTVVIHQGTILFEDHFQGIKSPALEINDISLTLINDPLPSVSLRGAANSEMLGKLHWQGQWERVTGAVEFTFKAEVVPVTHQLVTRLVGAARASELSGLNLKAAADLDGRCSFRPDQKPALAYDVHCQVRQGTVQHPQLPLPLDDLNIRLDVANGEVRIEQATARSGPAELALKGTGQLPALDQDFEAEIEIKHLPLCDDLCARLPEKLRNLCRIYQPSGPTTIHLACARQQGQWSLLSSGKASSVSLRPENLSIAFVKYPYPLERLTGVLDYNLLNRHVQVDLTGYAGDRPVFIQGYWTGEGPQADASIDVHATDVAMEDKMIDALPPIPQKLARSFHGQGRFDVKAHVRHKPGAATFHSEYHLRFRDTSILWDDFPYPLEHVSGVLDVYPGRWEFHEFKGRHHDGQVSINGKSNPTILPGGEQGHGVTVEIEGHNIALDDDLHKALRPIAPLWKAWEIFHPTGRLTFTAKVDRPTPLGQDLNVDVDARGPTLEPAFFAYSLQDISGQFSFHKHRLDLSKVRAHHGATQLALDSGWVDLFPGGYYSNVQVQARDLHLDQDLIQAVPKKLKEGVRALKTKGPIRLQSHIVVHQAPEPGSVPDVYWDGQAWLQDMALTAGLELSHVSGTTACRGRHNGHQLLFLKGDTLLDDATAFKQPFKAVRIPFEVSQNAPDRLLLGLHAPVFGGDIVGQVRVDFNSSVRYELNLTASQIDLGQFAKHNLGSDAHMQGTAGARLHLAGQGNGLDSLEGHGSIDVPTGRLGKDLPFLLDLFKFLGLHWPDRTAFEELHAAFGIQGKRVSMRRLDLMGNAVSLAGKGEFNLDGTDVQLDFYPTPARLDQLLPPAVREMPLVVSKNLLTLEVRGKIGGNPDELRFQKKLIPIVVDPLTTLRDRIVGPAIGEKKN